MERLLVETGMKGPGWIDVSQYVPSDARVSHCKYEFTVDMTRMKDIAYVSDSVQAPTPPLRMMAVNVLTALNKKRENEICMISLLVNNKAPVDGLTAEPTKCAGDDQAPRPDLIVGHDASATINRLMARLAKHDIKTWPFMGRLKRSIPLKQIAHTKAAQSEMTVGRLVLDTKTSSMELVRCRSYELTELVEGLLNARIAALPDPGDIPAYYATSTQLLKLIKNSWNESRWTVKLAAHVNALPLAFQITNVVGGVTSRTLMGGRAERNEFHLLHAFHRNDMISPDKAQSQFKHKDTQSTQQSATQKHVKKDDEGDEEEDGPGAAHPAEADHKKKTQYSGGLVLEPKRGLYDTMILCLDFNSLYPSIIQEYNICFSTVNYTQKDSDDLPEPPNQTLAEGILPESFEASSNADDAEKKQLDIRQMALKLTANSMYGCLGFQMSRFTRNPSPHLSRRRGERF
ncbi:unnamed protein product, partial [Mesorhabditis spiculigera]